MHGPGHEPGFQTPAARVLSLAIWSQAQVSNTLHWRRSNSDLEFEWMVKLLIYRARNSDSSPCPANSNNIFQNISISTYTYIYIYKFSNFRNKFIFLKEVSNLREVMN